MREIKFEFWASHTEKMITMKEAIEEWTLEFILRKSDTFKVRQYTWLKDKNWKEIYEMDIVNCQWGNYEVFFIDWIFYTKSKHIQIPLYSLPVKEIIWNIYENPNLLNND